MYAHIYTRMMFMNECLRERMREELNSIYYQHILNANEDHITLIFVVNSFAYCVSANFDTEGLFK